MARSSTYKDDRMPVGRTEIMLLMARRKRVVLSTLPWGTPSCWGREGM